MPASAMIAIAWDGGSILPKRLTLLHISLRATQVAEHEINVGNLPISNKKKSLVIRMLARIGYFEVDVEG